MQVCSKIVHKYTFLDLFPFRLCAWCPLYTQIKRFKRVLLFECAVIPPLRLKSICVRTQIAKTEYLPAEYIRGTFWLVPPPPFPQVDGGGCYREKFFLILFLTFAHNLSEVWIENIIFWILHSLFLLRIFFLFFQSRLTRFKFLDISHEFRFLVYPI